MGAKRHANDRDNGGLEIFCEVESEDDDAP